MKRLWILSTAVFALFFIVSCGSENKNESEPQQEDESGFKAVDVGECRHAEPPLSFRDRIYTEKENEFSCNEYVEVTEKKENTIKFNWFGEMHCGDDWEYGYKVEGIEANVLKVNILERDTDLDLAAGCDECCYLMPIEYTASTPEEIDSIKAIEINYEGKNHKVTFQIGEETTDPETPDEEVSAQCEYDGQKYDLGYEIATDICQTSICTGDDDEGGFFGFLDWEACEYCYYHDEIEDAQKQAAIGDRHDFTCPDGSKVDWCECVADDLLGQKWKCADRVDLNCPKE